MEMTANRLALTSVLKGPVDDMIKETSTFVVGQ